MFVLSSSNSKEILCKYFFLFHSWFTVSCGVGYNPQLSWQLHDYEIVSANHENVMSLCG